MTTILCTIVLFEAVSYACSGCTRWSSSEFIELKNRDGKSPHVLSSSRRTDTCVNISLVKLEILIQLITPEKVTNYRL